MDARLHFTEGTLTDILANHVVANASTLTTWLLCVVHRQWGSRSISACRIHGRLPVGSIPRRGDPELSKRLILWVLALLWLGLLGILNASKFAHLSVFVCA